MFVLNVEKDTLGISAELGIVVHVGFHGPETSLRKLGSLTLIGLTL